LIRLLPPLVILQGFCLYHAYRNNSDQKWYYLIMLIPLIGCILYLYHHFYSRHNVLEAAEEIKGIVNSNYELEKLETNLKFSNSITNKTRLADKYLEFKRYKDAAELYESALLVDDDDPYLLMKLVDTHFEDKNYGEVVKYGNKVKNHRDFEDSEERICLAWSLFHIGEIEKSEEHFKDMDSKFTNYLHRTQYALFLEKSNRKDKGLEKLREMLIEYEQLSAYERSNKRDIIRIVKNTYQEMERR